MSQALSSLVLLALVIWIFLSVRRVAQGSAKARGRILLLSGLAIGAALIIAFVVPRWVPETPGSPGALVVIALLWVGAAVVVMWALPALIAALTVRPRTPEDGEPRA